MQAMCETTFNVEEKIWSGPEFKQYYDRNCSFGRIAFEEMRRRAKNICQISDTEQISLTFGEVRLQAIVGIVGRNTSYLMALVVACFFHGSAYHALSPDFDKETAKKLFEITKPKIIFCDGQDFELVQYAAANIESKIYTLKNHRAGVPTIFELMEATGDEHQYEPAELENGPEQSLAILCSSGTSGLQKAGTIPHCCRILSMAYLHASDDIYLATSTIDWLSGPCFLMSSIVHGFTRIITDKPLTPEYFSEIIYKYKITIIFMLPLMMAALAKHPGITAEKFDSIRHFSYGGYKCNLPIEQKIQSLLRNCTIRNSYGFTEFNSAVTLNFDFETKPKSLGKLLSGVKVCIVNQHGERLGPNEIGEICCRHDEYWGGYFDNDEATRGIYDKNVGWFRTGDSGFFDEAHFLYLVDRLKDILSYRKMRFYPSEIEAVIAQLPDVKDVCVFGIEDGVNGERAAAAVVLVKGSSMKAEDIVDFVQQNEVAWFRHLHGGCKIFKELPKTASMKISRRAVKDLFLKGSNINGEVCIQDKK